MSARSERTINTAGYPGTAETDRWNGPDGHHWAANAARLDAMAAGYTEQLMTVAALQPADRVLDIGCGTGQTTRLAARRVSAGHATGSRTRSGCKTC